MIGTRKGSAREDGTYYVRGLAATSIRNHGGTNHVSYEVRFLLRITPLG